jgi:hypothetical protein
MKSDRSSLIKPLALVGVLVLALVYLLVWRPRVAEVGDINRDREAKEQELAGLQAAAAPKPADTDPATLAMEAAIPPQPQLPDLLRKLQAIATETGTDQKTLSPAAPATVTGVPGASIQLTISTSGPRAGVYAYLHRLGTLERLLVVDKVSLSVPAADPTLPVPAEGVLNAEISARVFTSAAAAAPAS